MGTTNGPQAVNDPLTFLTFITKHPLGDEVVGVVSTFVSHGAMVDVGDMHCYVPLSGLGVPAPKSARAVLTKGETRRFIVVRLDPPRRGAQLALAELRQSPGLDLPGPVTREAESGTTASSPPGRGVKIAKQPKASRADKAGSAGKPAQAKRASKPATPAKRAKSGKPANPATTANPAQRAKSGKPANPAKAPRLATTAGKQSPTKTTSAPGASSRGSARKR